MADKPTRLHYDTFLMRLGACKVARDWSKGKGFKKCWATCEDPIWMWWLVSRVRNTWSGGPKGLTYEQWQKGYDAMYLGMGRTTARATADRLRKAITYKQMLDAIYVWRKEEARTNRDNIANKYRRRYKR